MTNATSGTRRCYPPPGPTSLQTLVAPSAGPADGTTSLAPVHSNLSGTLEGVSERFVADRDRGRLIEVEHLARYRWAAQVAAGRTVLDAGCGSAYGCRLLAEAGARRVLGLDIAASVVESVGGDLPSTVTLSTGDVRALELESASVELVTCFEVLEQLEDPETALDELARVLTPGGLLLVSSPNPGVRPPGNPHHRHELTPPQLEAALRERLAHVTLLRQRDYIVSAILSDAEEARGDGEPVQDAPLGKLNPGRPGEETYTIAAAGHAELPHLPRPGADDRHPGAERWLSGAETQTNAIRDRDRQIAGLQQRVGERDQLAVLLTDAEQRAAGIPELRTRIGDLEADLAHARRELEASRAEAHALDDRLMRSERVLVDMRNSPSWQLTRPLRSAKKLLR